MVSGRFVLGTLAVLALAGVIAAAWQDVPASEPVATADADLPDAMVGPALSSKIAELQPEPWGPEPLLFRNAPPPTVFASAYIVMDEASGAVLLERNAETPLPPASLTKIATAVVALKAGGLDQWVTVDVDSTAMPGSAIMGLLPGDQFRLRDLLYGTMLPSGNDAALAVARGVAGSDAVFVARMNALMAGLGLVESHFANPHGQDATGHRTSAYDMAVLTRYAMSIPEFRDMAAARYWTAAGSRNIGMWTSNALIGQYEGGDGVKVGFTDRAGHTLSASATRDGHRVIVVLLNAPQSQAEARELLDWAFANHVWPQE